MIKKTVWEHPKKKGEERGHKGFVFVQRMRDNLYTPGTVSVRDDELLVVIRASAGQNDSVVILDNEADLCLVCDALNRICRDKGIV